MVFHRNPDLLGALPLEEATLTCGRIEVHEAFQHILTLGCQPLPPTNSSGVFPLTVRSIHYTFKKQWWGSEIKREGEKLFGIEESFLLQV